MPRCFAPKNPYAASCDRVYKGMLFRKVTAPLSTVDNSGYCASKLLIDESNQSISISRGSLAKLLVTATCRSATLARLLTLDLQLL